MAPSAGGTESYGRSSYQYCECFYRVMEQRKYRLKKQKNKRKFGFLSNMSCLRSCFFQRYFNNLKVKDKGRQLMISGEQKDLISGCYPVDILDIRLLDSFCFLCFNMSVFSDFFSFLLFDHCPLISG